MTDTVTILSYYEPHTLQSNSVCTASWLPIFLLYSDNNFRFTRCNHMTSLIVSNVRGHQMEFRLLYANDKINL